MKKLLALTLALLMLCSFALAEDYTGTWYLNDTTHSSWEGVRKVPAYDGYMLAKLVLNDDGTFEYEFEDHFGYKSGTYQVVGSTVELYDENGELYITLLETVGLLVYADEDFGVLSLIRLEPGEKISAENADAFEGEWQSIAFTMENFGDGKYPTGYGRGTVWLTIAKEGEDWDVPITLSDDNKEKSFDGRGGLVYDQDENAFLFAYFEELNETEIEIYLMENGMIGLPYEIESNYNGTMYGTLYLEKVVIE